MLALTWIGCAWGFVSGLFVVLGTILKWKLLIDPPQNMWWLCYSQLWIKWRFGSKAVIMFNYASGSIVLLGSIVLAIRVLTGDAKVGIFIGR
jgi:hypothetical protein